MSCIRAANLAHFGDEKFEKFGHLFHPFLVRAKDCFRLGFRFGFGFGLPLRFGKVVLLSGFGQERLVGRDADVGLDGGDSRMK